jgi:hypothetical protein
MGTAAGDAAQARRRRRIIMAVIVVLILITAVVILVVMKPFTVYSPPNGAVLGAMTIWFSPAGRAPVCNMAFRRVGLGLWPS